MFDRQHLQVLDQRRFAAEIQSNFVTEKKRKPGLNSKLNHSLKSKKEKRILFTKTQIFVMFSECHRAGNERSQMTGKVQRV